MAEKYPKPDIEVEDDRHGRPMRYYINGQPYAPDGFRVQIRRMIEAGNPHGVKIAEKVLKLAPEELGVKKVQGAQKTEHLGDLNTLMQERTNLMRAMRQASSTGENRRVHLARLNEVEESIRRIQSSASKINVPDPLRGGTKPAYIPTHRQGMPPVQAAPAAPGSATQAAAPAPPAQTNLTPTGAALAAAGGPAPGAAMSGRPMRRAVLRDIARAHGITEKEAEEQARQQGIVVVE